jgi:hypothetical protein
VNTPGIIKAHTHVVPELHLMPGTITKSKTIIIGEIKEEHFWFQFNKPITKKGHLKGWTGIWLLREYITT